LDSFLMQETNFECEILVHDDASTDGTSDIVREYEKKHPNLFRNVYQEENQFLIQNTLTNVLFPMAKGKYIALCEGDDYWTDPNKLQKQVDFLEANEELSMCFTNGVTITENSLTLDPIISNDYHPNKFDTKYLISKDCRIPTASVVFRKNLLDIDLNDFPMGDYPLYYFLSKKGLIGYLSESSVAYRIHQTSFLRSHSIKQLKRNQILCIQKILERDKSELKTLRYNMSVHYDELAGLEIRDKNFIQFFKILYKTLISYPYRNLRQWRDTIYRLRKYE
ncbi:glycosyltransferase, partial [bacterium]|nr:glycosyltransferase [bacterium]